jgi:hypothetical protein
MILCIIWCLVPTYILLSYYSMLVACIAHNTSYYLCIVIQQQEHTNVKELIRVSNPSVLLRVPLETPPKTSHLRPRSRCGLVVCILAAHSALLLLGAAHPPASDDVSPHVVGAVGLAPALFAWLERGPTASADWPD